MAQQQAAVFSDKGVLFQFTFAQLLHQEWNNVQVSARQELRQLSERADGTLKMKLEMWANAQRDGRPAEYRWRPLFNAAKFG